MNIVIDIGSTIIKVVMLDGDAISSYRFHDRDYSVHISTQVTKLLRECAVRYPDARYRICSSANGGLRIGLICLTERFSGNVARNLVLAAGGNVAFMDFVDSANHCSEPVDALVVVGGIDCSDATHLRARLARFDAHRYQYASLIYAGNRYLSHEFLGRHPEAVVLKNPLGDGLSVANDELRDKIRDLYLDDLVDKDGVSSLQPFSDTPIWPTPSIVNLAFDRISKNGSAAQYLSPLIMFDIGGATTDVHFGLEVVAGGHDNRPDSYLSSNRHVFTDLGVFLSRNSALDRLAKHERLYDFFRIVNGPDASRSYADFREGQVADEIPFYACFFLALDSLADGQDATSPTLSISKISSIIVTGGAAKRLDPSLLSELTTLFLPGGHGGGIPVHLDAGYSIWLDGMNRLPLLALEVR